MNVSKAKVLKDVYKVDIPVLSGLEEVWVVAQVWYSVTLWGRG